MDMMNPSEMVSRLDYVLLELAEAGIDFLDSPRVSGILGVFIEQRGGAGHDQGKQHWRPEN